MTTLERTVTVLPPDPQYLQKMIQQKQRRLRVAAYCRVSTDEEEQLSSYEAQLRYYTEFINSKEDWQMVGVFADEGITGTSTKSRAEFLKLMELCRRGKVDMILVKSISRFARNTLDCITYIRLLKELNVTVIFEKEGINTSEMTSEVMLTFLAAFAQAESESISGNVTWGKRKAFQDGKVSYQYSRLLGYERGEDGKPKIVPAQAEIVKLIYSWYLSGHSIPMIKQELEKAKAPSSTGKSEWSHSKIQRILQNELYIGDAILQKTYTVDCISKKRQVNMGEIPKYYVTDCHEAIIDRDIFNMVQEEIARRSGKQKVSQKRTKTENGKHSGKYALSGLLVCSECGAHYRRATWARNGQKRIVWRCISRLEFGTKYCKCSPTLDEDVLHSAIVKAMQAIADHKDELMTDAEEFIKLALQNDGDNGVNIAAISEKIKKLQNEMLTLVDKRVKTAVSADSYDEQFKSLAGEIAALQEKLDSMNRQGQLDESTSSRLDYIFSLIESESFAIDHYDDSLVRLLVESVTVKGADRLVVRFKDFGEREVGT